MIIEQNNIPRTCMYVCVSFLILVHLGDASLGMQTNFTVLSLFLPSTFDTPWNYFHISVVLIEKELDKPLAQICIHP